jgi:hypothetical protein
MLISIIGGVSNAGESIMDTQSMRAYAMGNAFNAFCKDPATLMYNPAGLSFISHLTVSWEPACGGLNNPETLMDLIGNLGSMQGKSWDELSSDEKNKFIRVYDLGLSWNLSPLYVILPTDTFLGSVGFSFHPMVGNINGILDPGVFVPTISLVGTFDTITTFGFSQKINKYWQDLSGTLSVGLSVNSLQRNKLDGFITLSNLLAGGDAFTNISSSGTATGINLGTIYQPPDKENLNFALVLRDVGGTEIKWGNNSSSKIDGRLNLGVSWKPIRLYYWPGKFTRPNDRLILCADINNIGSGGDFFNKIHLGSEWNPPILPFLLRFGFNQGWFTWGFKFIFLEYTYYVEELSDFAGVSASTRHFLNFLIRF